MDVVLQRLLEDKGEVGALGAITIVIGALIIDLSHGHIEESLGALNLRRDLWKVGNFERCAILLDHIHQGHIVEIEFVILDGKFVLRELKSLLNEVDVLILHLLELEINIKSGLATLPNFCQSRRATLHKNDATKKTILFRFINITTFFLQKRLKIQGKRVILSNILTHDGRPYAPSSGNSKFSKRLW